MHNLRLPAFFTIATLTLANSIEAGIARSGPSGGFSSDGPHHVYLVGRLVITEPKMAFDPRSPDKGEGYVTIENRSGSTARLVAATSEMAHVIVVASDGETPREGYDLLTIRPHQTVQMKKNGVHFRFEGLGSHAAGQPSVRVKLTFERAGPLHVVFEADGDGTPQ